MDNNIKFLIHNNFREYPKQDKDKTIITKVTIINIPILINGKNVFCNFESEYCYREKPESKLLWSLRGINLCDYKIQEKFKEPMLILESNQLATSFYLLAMAQKDLKIILYKKDDRDDTLKISVSLEIAKAIADEFSNAQCACIQWLTKDEMLKNKEEK